MRPSPLLPYSAVILLWAVPSVGSADPCALPARYTHTAVVVEGDLQVTIGTDAASYAPGDTVFMAVVFENTGSDTLRYSNDTDPIFGFSIVGDSCATADAPGCFDDGLWYFPQVFGQPGIQLVLPPGECGQYAVYWDGTLLFPAAAGANQPAPAGDYRLFGGIWTFTTGGFGFLVPTGGVMLPFTIASGSPAAATTWGAIKTRYH